MVGADVRLLVLAAETAGSPGEAAGGSSWQPRQTGGKLLEGSRLRQQVACGVGGAERGRMIL